jgi:hypothetical protein
VAHLKNKTKGSILLLIFFSPLLLLILLMVGVVIKGIVQEMGMWFIYVSLPLVSWLAIGHLATKYLNMAENETVA